MSKSKGRQKELEEVLGVWDILKERGLVGNGRGRPIKLTHTRQVEIYELWAGKHATQEELAEKYSVGIATIERVIRRWKPVLGIPKRRKGNGT